MDNKGIVPGGREGLYCHAFLVFKVYINSSPLSCSEISKSLTILAYCCNYPLYTMQCFYICVTQKCEIVETILYFAIYTQA